MRIDARIERDKAAPEITFCTILNVEGSAQLLLINIAATHAGYIDNDLRISVPQ